MLCSPWSATGSSPNSTRSTRRPRLRADCPLFPPGDFTRRLTVTTPDPFLVVAGDHVRVDLPVALMERAATSGLLAANTLLSLWGLPGHVVWSVPNQGRIPLARHLLPPLPRTQPLSALG